jgi:type II secretory pathway pseudopilin PulG
MTLVEVMVAIVILTVSVYILSSTVTATIAHSAVKRERAMAVESSMNLLERMRSEPFDELFARYNDFPDDDPGGIGTAPGKHFAILGLDPQEADKDGMVGEVVLPSGGSVAQVAGGRQLREDVELPALSMPRDLNGDLMIDDKDHSADYIVLPVTIRISWLGKAGKRDFEMSTMFAKLEKASQ